MRRRKTKRNKRLWQCIGSSLHDISEVSRLFLRSFHPYFGSANAGRCYLSLLWGNSVLEFDNTLYMQLCITMPAMLFHSCSCCLRLWVTLKLCIFVFSILKFKMNFYVLHHFIAENEEGIQHNKISKRNSHIRAQNEIFELPEDEFSEHFHLSKEGFEILYKGDLKYYTIKFKIIWR